MSDTLSALDAPVRSLRIDAVEDCLRLSADRRWPWEERKWRLLFEVGEVYGIDAPDGGLAGTVVSTRYATGVAAVSMMLVAERFERRGLGRRLMDHALADAGTATVALTATDAGRPLYEQVGFRTIGRSTRYTGRLRPGKRGPEVSRPARAEDLPGVLALDAEVFGAPRDVLLRRLPSFCEQIRVVDGPSGVTAFGGAWRNVDNTVIGPVVAPDTATAVALIGELAAAATGELRLDLEDRHPTLADWASAHGFAANGRTAVMIHGEPLPGDRSRLFNPLMVALG